MPFKLFQYTSSIFIKAILVVTLIFASSFFIIELTELTINMHKSQISIFTMMKISISRTPFIIQETSLLLLFTALIYTFVSLAKSNEYTAIKASGISLKQFLFPFVFVSFLFSTIIITVLNPISSHLLLYGNHIKHVANKETSEPLTLSKYGIMLLDMPKLHKEELYIISAEQLREKSSKEIWLYNTSYIITSPDYIFKKRIDAEKAILKKNEWILTNAIEKQVKTNSIRYQEKILPSSLSPQDLINSFRKPKQISIWALPNFISTLKIIGGSTEQYTQYLYKLLITPFLTLGLVCMSASFSLKSTRNSKNQQIIAFGTVVGFVTFLYVEILMKLQLSDSFPSINSFITVISFTIIGIMMLYLAEKKYAF
ncbi:MAG: LptF/LptG family permease [Rickettsiales bacterium]|nr:LptF/LptG family permease [Rickettsiales bacterium]